MTLMDVTKFIVPETIAALPPSSKIVANEKGELFVLLPSGASVPLNDLLP